MGEIKIQIYIELEIILKKEKKLNHRKEKKIHNE